MHTSHCQIVVVVVGQGYPTHHYCYDSAHLEELGHYVAENAENVGEGYLGHFALTEETTFFEYPGAEESSKNAYENGGQDSSNEWTYYFFYNLACSHFVVDFVEKSSDDFIDNDSHCIINETLSKDDGEKFRELTGFDESEGSHTIGCGDSGSIFNNKCSF